MPNIKINGTRVQYPPHNDGNIINCHLSETWITANGYEDKTQEWIDAFILENTAEEPDKTIFDKLKIRRACRALGLEDKLNAVLASSAEFLSDWTDSTAGIDVTDSVLLRALQEGTFTEEEIQEITKALQ